MRNLYQCQTARCKEAWPSPQATDGGRAVSFTTCPKCGTAAKVVGSCE